MKNRRTLLSILLGSIAVLSASIASAEIAPNATIELIVPYSAGGPLDVTARILADSAKESLGANIIVINKPGAGGNIGANAIAKATPNGLTIGIAATATHAVNPWLYSQIPFNASKDFAPITQMVRVPNVLVMNVDTAKRLGVSSVAELIAYAKANPGKLNYGSGGNGSAGHLAGELFESQTGISAQHIPYNGANPAQLALLAGQVDFNFDNLATAAPNIRSGKLKALALTSALPSSMLPDVPLMSQTLSGFSIDTWWGLVAPANTPVETINQLNHAFVKALNHPDVKARFAMLWAEPAPSTPAEFKALMQQELKKYQQLVEASGAKID